MCVCERDKRKMWYCLVSFPSVHFWLSTSLSVLEESLYWPDKLARVCLLSTHTHVIVHARLWMLCCNANLNKLPCPVLCANANVYISSFTAVSLSSSLSKVRHLDREYCASFPSCSSSALHLSPFLSSLLVFFSFALPLLSLHSLGLFLWSPVEVKRSTCH